MFYSRPVLSFSLEVERQDLGYADLSLCRQFLLLTAGQPFSVQPGAIHAVVHYQKTTARRIAPHAQMFAGYFVVGIQSQVHQNVVAAASNADLVLHHVINLRTGVVFIVDFGQNTVARLARPRVRTHRGLAIEQRGLGSVIARLWNFVQLGVDLDVAQRHHTFRIREEFEGPILASDLIGLSILTGTDDAQAERFRIQLLQTSCESPLGVFFDQIKDAREPGIIIRVKIEAEDARQQGAVRHLELPQFHVPDELVDDCPAGDPAFGLTFHLRHAVNLHLDFDAARVAAGFATRLVILSLDLLGERHSPQPRWPPARSAGRRLLLKLP